MVQKGSRSFKMDQGRTISFKRVQNSQMCSNKGFIRFKMGQEGSRRFIKVPEGSGRFRKVQECSIVFKMVQNGSRWFKKVKER